MTVFDELLSILPRDLREAIDVAVASDRYDSFGDVLLEALYRWNDGEILRNAKLEQLRGMIAEAEAGPTYSSDEVFAELRARIAERQARMAAAE
jgi:Arc/MetJ-type ribon-helix-helix transcriptional regulator